MITDEDVKQQFQKYVNAPDTVSGMLKLRKRRRDGFHLDTKVSIQVARGIPVNEWGCAQQAVCTRHTAVFNTFGVIPKYCFDCFKVQIRARNVIELFKVLMLYDRLALPRDITRKCMVETRNYSAGPYKGYLYCRGYEEGSEVLEIVRQAVSAEISAEVAIRMTHCETEYSVVYPEFAEVEPEKQMKYRPEWQFYEDFVDENFVFDELEFPDSRNQVEPPPREIFAMQYWLRYAATIGDTSYLKLTNGRVLEPLPPRPKARPGP